MDTNADFNSLSPIDKGKTIRDMQRRTRLSIKDIAQSVGINYNTARRLAWEADMIHAGDTKVVDDELYRQLSDLAELSQAVREKIDPVCTHAYFEFETSVVVMMAGCMHLGGRWTAHEMVREMLADVLSLPGVRVGLFGDDVDGFLSGSFAGASSVYEQALAPDLQQKLFELFLDKIKDRVLFGMWGQHGVVWNEKIGSKYLKELYRARSITFFDGQGYIKLRAGEQEYNIAVSHKFPGHSMYNPVHAQKRALWQRYPSADVVAMADKHTYSVHQESVYQNEYLAGNRPSPMVTLLQVGTAKIGPDPYTIRGWERGVGMWPWVYFGANEHVVKVTTDIDDVKGWLARG